MVETTASAIDIKRKVVHAQSAKEPEEDLFAPVPGWIDILVITGSFKAERS